MIDFYNNDLLMEHPITPDMNIEDIKTALILLRRLWNQRETRNPERARIALSILDEADRVFENEQTKRAYDRQLAEQGNDDATIEIDFYNVGLGITQSMTAQQIISVLNQMKRQIQNGGIFTSEIYSKLALIEKGLETFKSEFSKMQYDAKLAQRNAPVNDMDSERRNKFESLWGKALHFYNDNLFDEALTIVQDALKYYDPDKDNVNVYRFIANIYSHKKNYTEAIKYYKKSITWDPANPQGYYMIALLLYYEESLDVTEECRKYANLAIQRAKEVNNPEMIANGYAVLAGSYLFKPPYNEELAKQYAEQYCVQASSGIAKQVLEHFENLRRMKEEEERQRKEEERQRKEEERRRKEELERRKREEKRHYITWTVLILVIILLIGILPSICSGSSRKSSSIPTQTITYTASQNTSNLGLSEKDDQTVNVYNAIEDTVSFDENELSTTFDGFLDVGYTYYFGNYEQDNKKDNGKEPIEWLVLSQEGSRILVISKNVLDARVYHSTKESVTWEKSSLRAWLNNNFYNQAFSAEEQKAIYANTVTADKNPDSSATPGNNTVDKVFLLSISEVNRYLRSEDEKLCQPSKYARSKGVYSKDGNCWWWLRSPGGRTMYASFVDTYGTISLSGSNVDYAEIGIRPALWIDLG